MERKIFWEKFKEVVKKMGDMLGYSYLDDIFPEDSDLDADYGVDEDGYLIIDREKTMFNISQLESIKYRAVEERLDEKPDTCYIVFRFKNDIALYLYFGLGDLGGVKELFYKGRRFDYWHSCVIITATHYGWDGENDFVITNDGSLVAYLGNERNITIPDGVIEIGRHAFKWSPVMSVELADTTRVIAEEAFGAATRLESIDLKNVEFIGKKAFCGSSLQKVVLPKSLREIEKAAFYGTLMQSIDDISNASNVEITEEIFKACQ